MVGSGLVLSSGLPVFTLTITTLHVALVDSASQTGSIFWDWLIFGRGSLLVASLSGTLFALAAFLKSRTVVKQLPVIQQQLNDVQEQTNGNTTYKDNRVSALESTLQENGIPIPRSELREEAPHAGNS